MPRDNSNFTASKILVSVRNSPVRREVSLGDVMKMRSPWPFTVEGDCGTMSRPPADKQAFTHKEASSFIT